MLSTLNFLYIELKSESEIDILVEFEAEHIPGLMDIAGMEVELTEMVGRKVDLCTPGELSRFFRDDVISKARIKSVCSIFLKKHLNLGSFRSTTI